MSVILSGCIVELFPSESKETYYIPYKKEGKKVPPNRGKLWDEYCNMRKVIRQITPINSTEINLISNLQQIRPIIGYENIEDDLVWLKNNISPWGVEVEKWKLTFSQRYNDLIKNTEEKKTYFDDFLPIKGAQGFMLIELDFNELYPSKEYLLYSSYDLFKVQLYNYIETYEPNLKIRYLTLMNEVKNPSKPGNNITATLKLFVELFNPVNVCCKRTIDNFPKKNWRPSKLEIQQGFINYINDVTQLREVDDAKWEKNKSIKQTVQPYIVFVGPGLSFQDGLEVSLFYVVINHNSFKLECS